jgi:hypothetical protein
VLVHHPHILDFRVKEKYFRDQIQKRIHAQGYHRIRLHVKR